MKILGLLSIVIAAAAATACGTSAGGGWIPSAGNPAKKATFGFSYSCDPSTNRLQGQFVYHDHGTGHKAIAEIDEPVPPELSCGTFLPGVTAACAVVRNGSGGVAVNDIMLAFSVDGKPAAQADGIGIALFPGSSTSLNACNGGAQNCASASSLEEYLQCLGGNDVGTPYYSNSGPLGGGNITWTD